MRTSNLLLALVLPTVAAFWIGCESAKDGAGAYWNNQPSTGGTTTPGNDAGTSADNGSDNGSGSTAPPANGVAADAIDPGSISYLHADVSRWTVTSPLNVSFSGGKINMNYKKANSWPVRNGVNANPWIIVNVNGRWTAATFEWFRPGQTSKPIGVVEGGHIKKSPLNNFRPKSGETYGFMVSSLARDGTRTVNERTNIVLAKWP